MHRERTDRPEGRELLDLLAAPTSVAVVGASRNITRPPGRPLHLLRTHGFAGTLVAVNPNADIPDVHTVRRLDALQPGSVDVVMIAVNADGVIGALEQAEHIGARAAVIIGSGFEDRAGENRRRLDRFLAGSTLRVVGPNCLGSVALAHGSLLTFSSVLMTERPTTGPIGLVTQSGALGNSLVQTLIRRSVGFSHWVSTGNEVDAGAVEIATGMLESDDVAAVGLFLEGITDRRWLERLEDALAAGNKRLFFLKAATSAAGGSAAAGHTGRVVGSADACRAVLREIGATEVPNVGALADALGLSSICPSTLSLAHPRVGVVSISGAGGVIAADRVARSGVLEMAPMGGADGARPTLDARLIPANPLDVPFLDETPVFAQSVRAVADPGVSDVVVAVESGLAHDRPTLVEALTARPGGGCPVVLTSLSEDDPIPSDLVTVLAAAGIAYMPTIERAIDAVAHCSRSTAPLPARDDDDGATNDLIGLEGIAEVLSADFPWARWQVIDDVAAASAAGEEFGYPFVLKAAGRTIVHRSELGAVSVVRSAEQLPDAFAAVSRACAAHGDVVVAQPMVAGMELMLSAVRDAELGPVGFVRLGGVTAERMALQTVLWGGWSAERREEVLRRSVVGELLDGYRGGVKYDIAAVNCVISEELRAVSEGLAFVELNPAVVTADGIRVVDAVGRRADRPV